MKLGGKPFGAPQQLLSLIRKSPLYALPIMLSNCNPGTAFAQEMKDTLNQVNEQLVSNAASSSINFTDAMAGDNESKA